MSSQPRASDPAVEAPTPHTAEVPLGEVLPEPAVSHSEGGSSSVQDIAVALSNVRGSAIVDISRLQEFNVRLSLCAQRMLAMVGEIQTLERNFHDFISRAERYDPNAQQERYNHKSAWRSVNPSGLRRPVRNNTMPTPSTNTAQQQDAGGSKESMLFGPHGLP